MVFQIGIGIAISISDEDRDRDRDLDFGDRGHALDKRNNRISPDNLRGHYYYL